MESSVTSAYLEPHGIESPWRDDPARRIFFDWVLSVAGLVGWGITAAMAIPGVLRGRPGVFAGEVGPKASVWCTAVLGGLVAFGYASGVLG